MKGLLIINNSGIAEAVKDLKSSPPEASLSSSQFATSFLLLASEKWDIFHLSFQHLNILTCQWYWQDNLDNSSPSYLLAFSRCSRIAKASTNNFWLWVFGLQVPRTDSATDDHHEPGMHRTDFGEQIESFPTLSIGLGTECEAHN